MEGFSDKETDIYAPKIGRRVELTEGEKRLVTKIVKLREKENERNNVHDRKMSDRSSRDINLDGYGAEFAFCKLFGTSLDKTHYSRGVSSDAGDTQLPSGKWVDVKCPRTKDLMTPVWKSKARADYYAMMVGSFEEGFEFRGLIQKEDFFQDRRRKMIRVESFVVPQKDLKELWQIERPESAPVLDSPEQKAA